MLWQLWSHLTEAQPICASPAASWTPRRHSFPCPALSSTRIVGCVETARGATADEPRHRLVEMGQHILGKEPSSWFGPTSAAQAVGHLFTSKAPNDLMQDERHASSHKLYKILCQDVSLSLSMLTCLYPHFFKIKHISLHFLTLKWRTTA